MKSESVIIELPHSLTKFTNTFIKLYFINSISIDINHLLISTQSLSTKTLIAEALLEKTLLISLVLVKQNHGQ